MEKYTFLSGSRGRKKNIHVFPSEFNNLITAAAV